MIVQQSPILEFLRKLLVSRPQRLAGHGRSRSMSDHPISRRIRVQERALDSVRLQCLFKRLAVAPEVVPAAGRRTRVGHRGDVVFPQEIHKGIQRIMGVSCRQDDASLGDHNASASSGWMTAVTGIELNLLSKFLGPQCRPDVPTVKTVYSARSNTLEPTPQ